MFKILLVFLAFLLGKVPIFCCIFVEFRGNFKGSCQGSDQGSDQGGGRRAAGGGRRAAGGGRRV